MTCDFYTQAQWNAAAVQMADLLQEHVFERRFGACPWLVGGYYVFFGNEGSEHVSALMTTVRQEIEMLPGMREVGYGVSTEENGYSWALIVDAADMLADDTDDVCDQMQEAIFRAWKIARGLLTNPTGRG